MSFSSQVTTFFMWNLYTSFEKLVHSYADSVHGPDARMTRAALKAW